MTNNKPKIFVHHFSCLVETLYFDYKKYFRSKGFEIVESPSDADFIILTTCASVEDAEKNMRSRILEINEMKKPNSSIITVGCLTKINKNLLADLDEVYQFGNYKEVIKFILSDVESIPHLSKNIVKNNHKSCSIDSYKFYKKNNTFDKITKKISVFRKKFMGYDYENFFNVLTNKGCSKKCAYCSIKFANGPPNSKKITEVIEEIRKGLSKGHKKIYLTANDLEEYGKDTGENLTELLENINKIEADFVVKIDDIYPKWLIKNFNDFLDIIEKDKIKSATFPVQSGSQKVLDDMKRNYNIEKVKKCFQKLKKRYPSFELHTQFIVGFPTESWKDFKKSLKFVEQTDISPRVKTTVTPYSERPNTIASEYKSKVCEKEKRIRKKLLDSKLNKSKIGTFLSHLKYRYWYSGW